MIQNQEQQPHKHHEESWPMFMSREQREQLIQNKFARAVNQHFKFHGEKLCLKQSYRNHLTEPPIK
jgi:hypothetical protein